MYFQYSHARLIPECIRPTSAMEKGIKYVSIRASQIRQNGRRGKNENQLSTHWNSSGTRARGKTNVNKRHTYYRLAAAATPPTYSLRRAVVDLMHIYIYALHVEPNNRCGNVTCARTQRINYNKKFKWSYEASLQKHRHLVALLTMRSTLAISSRVPPHHPAAVSRICLPGTNVYYSAEYADRSFC